MFRMAMMAVDKQLIGNGVYTPTWSGWIEDQWKLLEAGIEDVRIGGSCLAIYHADIWD